MTEGRTRRGAPFVKRTTGPSARDYAFRTRAPERVEPPCRMRRKKTKAKKKSGPQPIREPLRTIRREESRRRIRIRERTKRHLQSRPLRAKVRVTNWLFQSREASPGSEEYIEPRRGWGRANGSRVVKRVPRSMWDVPCPQCGSPPAYSWCVTCLGPYPGVPWALPIVEEEVIPPDTSRVVPVELGRRVWFGVPEVCWSGVWVVTR